MAHRVEDVCYLQASKGLNFRLQTKTNLELLGGCLCLDAVRSGTGEGEARNSREDSAAELLLARLSEIGAIRLLPVGQRGMTGMGQRR